MTTEKYLKGVIPIEKNRLIIKSLRDKTFTVSDNHRCKVISAGNIVEIITVKKPPPPIIAKYRRLNRDSCVDLETGEVIMYRQSSKRLENHQGLRKTFSALRRIINANFSGDEGFERHIVLTYGYQESDFNIVAKDFSKFWAKFMYHHGKCEYVRIIEPQQSGRWHLHLLVKKFDGSALNINYDQLHRLWGIGRVHVSKLPFTDNFGAYFSAMLRDLDVFEKLEIQDRPTNSMKTIVKGARLQFYPASFRFYTCSKGIIRPKAIAMAYGEARAMVAASKEVYTFTKQIVAEDELGNAVELNAVKYEQFNSKHHHIK